MIWWVIASIVIAPVAFFLGWKCGVEAMCWKFQERLDEIGGEEAREREALESMWAARP